MTANGPTSYYALGYSDAEQARLIRQAAQLAPLTERFFRDAGIGPGQRVLELGSGMGDVAMLVARIVGPEGHVLGIERDADSIKVAQARANEAGLRNVAFSQSDISQLQSPERFEAAVGRADRGAMLTMLLKVGFPEAGAGPCVDSILADPRPYGFEPMETGPS